MVADAAADDAQRLRGLDFEHGTGGGPTSRVTARTRQPGAGSTARRTACRVSGHSWAMAGSDWSAADQKAGGSSRISMRRSVVAIPRLSGSITGGGRHWQYR
jgi:hypothetical protein